MSKLRPVQDLVLWGVWVPTALGVALVSHFASEQAAINYVQSRRLSDAMIWAPMYADF